MKNQHSLHFVKTTLLTFIMLSVISCALLPSPTISLAQQTNVVVGDRKPRTHAIYPDSAYYHNGGRIIDITKPPFNATGNGKTDDTKAIVAAYDFIVNKIRQRIDNGDLWPIADMYTIFFPNGKYLVSDTIEYSGTALVYRNYGKSEGLNNIRFQGQSRENTVIKLKDKAVGFEKHQSKPVLSMSRRENNNLQTFNSIENLTIDTGSRNPGAIAINHAGANKTSLRNLLIRSSDGKGKAGIFIYTSPTHGYHTDITVKGFDYGIWMVPYHVTHNSFEYVTLSSQRKAAILVEDATTSLRAIKVQNNKGPAILQTGPGSQVAVVESSFEAYSWRKKLPAIKINAGSLFARAIHTYKYNKLVEGSRKPLLSGNKITEFAFPKTRIKAYSSLPHSKRSTNLFVKDEPPIQFPDSPSGWAEVDDYLSDAERKKNRPDYKQALQAALNSGKAYILFGRKNSYYISGAVTVPTGVKVINGLHTTVVVNPEISTPLFTIDSFTKEPLTIENFQINGNVVAHKSLRPLALRHLGSGGDIPYQNLNLQPGAELFLTVVTNIGKFDGAIHNQKVWARWINTESAYNTNFPVEATDMWVFGYKTEKYQSSFSATKGSRLEVLGGVTNQYYQQDHAQILIDNNGISPFPAFYIEDSEATLFACTNGPNSPTLHNYKYMLEVVNREHTWRLSKKHSQKRKGRKNQVFLPLIVIKN